MLQPDLNLQIRTLAETGKLSDLLSGERVSGVTRLQPGQAVAARVQAQLPDGRFMVHVEGRDVAMSLPQGTQPGKDIRLSYVGEDRHANFVLLQSLPAVADEAPSLSSAARLASTLMQTTAAADEMAPALPLSPVLDAPSTDPPLIEARLRQALSTSGLFYESHLSRWAAGEHRLEVLLLEPQAHLPPRSAQLAAHLPAEAQTTLLSHAGMTAEPVKGSSVAMGFMPGREAETPTRLPAHPDTLPIIQHQLAALESGQIQWQGQLWPGQPMDWQISEYQGRHGNHPEQDGWETTIGLSLEELGDVEARLRIQQGRITVNLSSDRPEKSRLMRDHLDLLAVALETAGLGVNSISVESRDV